MTIEQYMTMTGMQFWRSTGVSLLITLAEWLALLFFVHRYGTESFFDRRSLLLHLLSLLLFFPLQLWHLPVLPHCLLLVLLFGTYILLLTGCPWKNGLFEGCIFCLYVELGKSLCRDGLLAHGFSLLFPGIEPLALNLTMLGLYLAYLILACLLFSRRKAVLSLPLTGRQMAGLLFPFLLYLAVRLFQYREVSRLNELGWLRFDLLQYAIAICAILVMDTTESLLAGEIEKQEILQSQMLRDQWAQRYESQREAMEYIGKRYHDLKHYLTAMEAALDTAGEGKDLTDARQLIETIREETDPYARLQRTGSSVLDVLLSQRIQECQSKGIQLLPYIDGRSAGFLSTLDLCVLFGNAMDNAIEASQDLSGESLKEISVKVGQSDGFLVMRFQNFFEGGRSKNGPLWATTKKNSTGHGFGLRSIAATAEKYAGSISTECEGNSFTLHVLIPLPEPQTESTRGEK